MTEHNELPEVNGRYLPERSLGSQAAGRFYVGVDAEISTCARRHGLPQQQARRRHCHQPPSKIFQASHRPWSASRSVPHRKAGPAPEQQAATRLPWAAAAAAAAPR